jgi:hypothetical protein
MKEQIAEAGTGEMLLLRDLCKNRSQMLRADGEEDYMLDFGSKGWVAEIGIGSFHAGGVAMDGANTLASVGSCKT